MTKNESARLLASTLANTHSLERAPSHIVVRDLIGLQAQFSRNPELSLRLRANDLNAHPWDDGLVKIWCQRSTIHVIRRDELGLYLSAADQRGDYRDGWWGMTSKEQAYWAPFIEEQIALGVNTRDMLKEVCLKKGMSPELLQKAFYGWGGLIKEMVRRGRIVCGTGTDKRYALAGEVQWMDRDEARLKLIRRYFDTYGPATRKDCAAFFQWSNQEVKPLLDSVLHEIDSIQIDCICYYYSKPLPDDTVPECVLLPGFDSTVLAYRDRSRMIDPMHLRKVVNMAGIVFPIALLRGKARAKWKLQNNRMEVEPFERLLKKDIAALRRTAKKELGIKELQIIE
ncbi:MAG: AlkZ family DNA glycosylase [Clostridia bacterium]|nr:AlkZ family DNA glycosylase [Clostridia bacterium]